jgi:hypothetical protein
MIMSVRRPILQFEVRAFATACRRKMFAFNARHRIDTDTLTISPCGSISEGAAPVKSATGGLAAFLLGELHRPAIAVSRLNVNRWTTRQATRRDPDVLRSADERTN